MKNLNNNEAVKLEMPTTLVDEIRELFQEETTKMIDKILFTVSIINKGKWNGKKHEKYYELSLREYNTYISSSGKIYNWISKLIDKGIITAVGGYKKGSHYQRFEITEAYRFDYTKLSNNKKEDIYLHRDTYAFARHYINDNYIVNYKTKNKLTNKQDEKDLLIVSLQKRIEELESLLLSNDEAKVTTNALLESYDLVEPVNDIQEEVTPAPVEEIVFWEEDDEMDAFDIAIQESTGVKWSEVGKALEKGIEVIKKEEETLKQVDFNSTGNNHNDLVTYVSALYPSIKEVDQCVVSFLNGNQRLRNELRKILGETEADRFVRNLKTKLN